MNSFISSIIGVEGRVRIELVAILVCGVCCVSHVSGSQNTSTKLAQKTVRVWGSNPRNGLASLAKESR